jgi:cysteine desulfurase/selenocysteine lyase
MLNVMEIREDFPILKKEINGKPLIYFDNAATTHKPNQVIDAITRFYREYNSNVHRGMHTLSQEASMLYEESFNIISKFINAYSWEEVIEVKNATDGLNMVAWGWGFFNLKPGDEIILTVMDHHSNMLPWRIVAERIGAKIKYVDIKDDGDIDYEQLEQLIGEKTRVVAITMASNVLGTIVDVKRVCKIAHSVGAIVVGDGAQYVPHVPTNVRDLEIDFIAFSGHKMLGPTGIGILWGRRDVLEEMKPFRVGGDTIKDVTLDAIEWHDLPWRFIAGTPHIAGMIGLAEAAKYLMRIGMENIRQHDIELTEYTLKKFKELGSEVTVLGPINPEKRTGIVSFNLSDLHYHTVAKALDSFGIAVRSGGHCAHPLHYRLGFKGSVRASFYIYNTIDEVDTFISALKFIVALKDMLSKERIEDRCTGT